MRSIARRAAAVLAVPALSLTACATTSSPAEVEADVPDPAPAAAATDWLTGQLSDGLVLGTYPDPKGNLYPDYGLTIDVALALDAIGEDTGRKTIVDGLTAHIAGAEGYTEADEEDQKGKVVGRGRYAGPAAKALRLAQVAGEDERTYGGVDLVQATEDRVATTGPIAGRIEDDSSFGDYANVIGQIYAAAGLTAAGSDAAPSVREFLLDQQCADGFFRLYFTPDKAAADQSCDGGTAKQSAPDPDVTAQFVTAMHEFESDPAIASAIDDAVTWLEGRQRPDGSFRGGPTTAQPNTNSTGLVGRALAQAGRSDAAEAAAAWVRAHQATNVERCAPYAAADLGAVAYDDADRTATQGAPMSAEARYKAVRSTSQALSVLTLAPAATGDATARLAGDEAKAGTTRSVEVTGAAPGEALCATLDDRSVLGYADRDGAVRLPVAIPNRTATGTISVANADGTLDTVAVDGEAGDGKASGSARGAS